jgi:tetratricopeptide (TPR) repeat protein
MKRRGNILRWILAAALAFSITATGALNNDRVDSLVSQARGKPADSALQCLNQALLLAEESGQAGLLYNIYDEFSQVFSRSGNYPISLDYLYKMLDLADTEAAKSSDSVAVLKKYAGLFVRIGTCYFDMDNNAKALEYYLKSLDAVRRIIRFDPAFPEKEKLMVLYTNIGSAHLSSYHFAEAEANYETALRLNATLNNPVNESSLCNNLGIVFKEKKDFAGAFRYYNKALSIRQLLHDTAGMAQTLNNLGDAYYLTGDFQKAIEMLTMAMKMSRQKGNLRSQMKAANFLSLAYEKTGDPVRALAMHKLFKTLHDSIISNEQVQASTRLELRYLYEKQHKENQLQQEILVAKKERKALVYMTISGILLLSFGILFLLNRNQRMKMRQGKILQESLELERKNLTLEKQNLVMEKQQLQMELDFRNKELSTHVMYLLRKNEFIASIINKLLAVKRSGGNTENDPWIQEILHEMQSNVDNTVWGEFEMRFQQVHQDFYQKLLEKYPDLTPNEIKICAFMKLNMTTKDISAITFQSVKSIQVARNRLRKKMGIARDENLVATIQQL